MSDDVAIRVRGLAKTYLIYRKPHHRLLQMLRIRRRETWYDEFHALKPLDLDIRRGETVGIVGRNGSGKSTLLQLICGTLTPTSGSIEVAGRVAALLELGSGFNPEFTGRENVFLNGTLLGLRHEEVAERFDSIAAFADIGEFIEQPVKNYSSGMFVRLAFAVAIHVKPEILVVDEALSVGDEAFQRKCFAKIEEIRSSGTTILFVSHSAATVVDLCDRALLLDRGELLMEGTPKRVVASYQKLLYAPADHVEDIRADLRAGRAAEPRAGNGLSLSSAHPVAEDAWDAGLVPSSTVRYPSRGALIQDPHLQTLDGRRVNVLIPGQEYDYCYTVAVAQPLAGVRCGMMIRNVTGIEIGGLVAPLADEVRVVDVGTVLAVRFRWRCLLAPGVYFLNAGVVAQFGPSEEYVDRIVDAAMFRVMADRNRRVTGLVNLDFAPKLGVLE
ncbi:MAG TPA: ABC transporter ATP-binding protein [Lysobacter sp.]|nr:ABC transporter ATP-binding protein [Lysobacter sp.]